MEYGVATSTRIVQAQESTYGVTHLLGYGVMKTTRVISDPINILRRNTFGDYDGEETLISLLRRNIS